MNRGDRPPPQTSNGGPPGRDNDAAPTTPTPNETAATDVPGSIDQTPSPTPPIDGVNEANAAEHFSGALPRLKFSLYRDLQPNPQKHWLVEGWLGKGELSCFFGIPGSSKSTLVGDLAFRVAAGMDWFGQRTQVGGVLILAAERASLLERRMAALRKHYAIEDVPLAIVSGGIDLRSRGGDAKEIVGWARFLEKVTGVPTVLIIVDTISRVLAGGEENSSTDMGTLVANLSRIQESTEAHILAVHHTPADKERPRGHGLLLAACDTTVIVRPQRDYFTATIDKANDAVSGEAVTYKLRSIDLHHSADLDTITSAPVVECVSRAAISDRLTLSKRERILLGILTDAGTDGLAVEELNKRARDAGIGKTRPPDLYDARKSLLRKKLVFEHDGIFRASTFRDANIPM